MDKKDALNLGEQMRQIRNAALFAEDLATLLEPIDESGIKWGSLAYQRIERLANGGRDAAANKHVVARGGIEMDPDFATELLLRASSLGPLISRARRLP